MKALLLLAALAGSAFVGYSYISTDGQSCAVCPMTGRPLMTSTESEGSCCPGDDDAMLTSLDSEGPTCCSQAKGACCSDGDAMTSTEGKSCCSKDDAAMLTSLFAAKCEGSSKSDTCEEGCTKNCCQGKEQIAADAVETTQGVETAESKEEIVAEETETE